MENAKFETMVNGEKIWLAPDEELRNFAISNCSWKVGEYVPECTPALYSFDGKTIRSRRVVAMVEAPYETGGIMWANTKISVVVR